MIWMYWLVLTIQRSSEYLFGLLIVRPNFVLIHGATVFNGMSVFSGTAVVRDGVLAGSMIFSWLCLILIFSFPGI